MRFAERVFALQGESAFDVLSKVQRMERDGRDVVSFAIGEPDFDTPEHIKAAGIRAIEENHTHYTPSAGILPFREAIARYVGRTRGIDVSPDEVVVTPGAKPVLFCGILCCVNPGDEVLTPSPGFPTYESVIRYAGGAPVPLPFVEEKNFSFDPETFRRLVTPKTRMVLLNFPHNPTGGVASREDLEAVAAIAREKDLWVLSDEIYREMAYEGDVPSIASLPGMKERTIILDGFSKTYAMTGWRLGFAVLPRELAAHVTKLVTNSVSCTAAFVQTAGIAALEGPQDAARSMVAEYRARRDLLCDALATLPGVVCQKPRGAFYAYANVTEACRRLGVSDSRAFQEKLLEEAGVAVLSRNCFGSRNVGEDQEYVRFCYATSRERIAEGLRRIREFLER